MWRRVALVVVFAVATMMGARLTSAQTGPTPGPVNPTPNPLAKPGADMVINPTTEECEKGWRPDLKWTQAQFDSFCTQMKTSK